MISPESKRRAPSAVSRQMKHRRLKFS